MLARYLHEEAYDNLYGTVGAALTAYAIPNSDRFELDDSQFGESRTIDLERFSLVCPRLGATDVERSENDITNIKIVYNAWKTLAPLQAKNKYLWTYYCHADKKNVEYIIARWGQNGFSSSQIRERFFVTEEKRNLVRENALSSLWWKGYLTFDEGANNPYWILDTLKTTTNIADFLDTLNSYNPNRAKGVIGGVRQVMDERGMELLPNRPFRALNRYINRYSMVSPLDFFYVEEIEEFAKEKFGKILDTACVL